MTITCHILVDWFGVVERLARLLFRMSLEKMSLKSLFSAERLSVFIVKESYLQFEYQCCFVQVIKCIWNHPDAPVVYLACDLLGQEDLLQEVSKSFQNAKIYADKSKLSEYVMDLTIVDPDLLTDCQDLTRFQVQFLSITLVMCVS